MFCRACEDRTKCFVVHVKIEQNSLVCRSKRQIKLFQQAFKLYKRCNYRFVTFIQENCIKP